MLSIAAYTRSDQPTKCSPERPGDAEGQHSLGDDDRLFRPHSLMAEDNLTAAACWLLGLIITVEADHGSPRMEFCSGYGRLVLDPCVQY